MLQLARQDIEANPDAFSHEKKSPGYYASAPLSGYGYTINAECRISTFVQNHSYPQTLEVPDDDRILQGGNRKCQIVAPQ